MKSRIALVFVSFCLIFVLTIARILYIQLLPDTKLDRLKRNLYTTMVTLPPQRGKIFDRKGEELATTVSTQSLYADPSLIERPKRLAKKLSELLGGSKSEILEKLKMDKKFVWIRRQLDEDMAREIKDWNEPGLGFVEEGQRRYPNQTLLAHVLGFVGSDGNGLEGLEKKYDPELRGERHSLLFKRDARGRPLVLNGKVFQVSADGASVETTIDKELQYELERQLENVNRQQNADKSIGIIMDPITGEVLAMASYPTFDPNHPTVFSQELRRNRAVTDVFEPGSTFKIITVAAALRTGRIFPNSKYFCENGTFKIGSREIHEAEAKDKYGWLTVAEILEHSSNIGTTKIAFDVGREKVKQMISSFGFWSKSAIDLLGEAPGLSVSGDWPDHLLSNVSFGHGIGVTALQIANAYSAIANGGKLLQPFVVKRVVDSDGQTIESRAPRVTRQVLTPHEASMLTLMLSGATEEGGTGFLARVDGYPIAGKTGTAQKVNPKGSGYLKGAYLASFVGFFPANNPQFTILVVIDNPKKQFYGAQVAAPIFKHLASFALHHRGFMPIVVQPAQVQPQDLPVTADNKRPIQLDRMPMLSGLTLREASALLNSMNQHDFQLIGMGIAKNQIPQPNAPIKRGEKIRVYFSP